MKVTIKFNGLLMNMPQTVEDISVGQFVELRKTDPSDYISILSVLTRTPVETLLKTRFNPDSLDKIFLLTKNLSESLNDYMSEANEAARNKCSKSITIIDKVISIPEDLAKYAYWSTRKAVLIIQEEIEARADGTVFDIVERYPEMLAHYLYCPYTEMKYDEARAEEFVEIVNDIPLPEAVQLGNFIMLELSRFWKPSMLPYSVIIQKKKQGPIRRFLNSLVDLSR